MKFKFTIQYAVEPRPGRIMSDERIVETAGYVPMNTVIARAIASGERLAEIRSQYDYYGDPTINGVQPEDLEDVTRSPGFDIADASQYQEAFHSRRRQAKEDAESELNSEPEPEPKSD